MSNARKIIDKIQDENIRPEPGWVFSLAEWVKRISYVLFVLIGSISFSIILFAVSVNGFDMIQHFRHSGLESLLVILPVFWLGILLFFLGASIASIMQAGRAYKYTFSKWVALSTGLCITLGTLFFITGGAKWLEKTFETNIESYQSLLEKKTIIWSQPEMGTLSGEITDIQKDTIFMKDWDGKMWTIITVNAFIAPGVDRNVGSQIKLNGKKTGSLLFEAEKIRPWGGMPGKCADTRQ